MSSLGHSHDFTHSSPRASFKSVLPATFFFSVLSSLSQMLGLVFIGRRVQVGFPVPRRRVIVLLGPFKVFNLKLRHIVSNSVRETTRLGRSI